MPLAAVIPSRVPALAGAWAGRPRHGRPAPVGGRVAGLGRHRPQGPV